MVLLGRMMRVTGYHLRQRLIAAADLAKDGGGVMLEGMSGDNVQAIVDFVEAAQKCLNPLLTDDAVQNCWHAEKALTFMGQKQYPDPVAEAEAEAASRSSSSAPLLHSKHHLQRPGMPIAVASKGAAAAAAAAGGASGATIGSSGSAAGATAAANAAAERGRSSTAQECMRLDDLDSWFDLRLWPLSGTIAAATLALLRSGAQQYCTAHEDSSSTHISAATALEMLVTEPHSVQLNQLPEQLYAAGTALCNALPVPWLCNNSDCTNMVDSEAQLVGGKSCVCGGCKVAR